MSVLECEICTCQTIVFSSCFLGKTMLEREPWFLSFRMHFIASAFPAATDVQWVLAGSVPLPGKVPALSSMDVISEHRSIKETSNQCTMCLLDHEWDPGSISSTKGEEKKSQNDFKQIKCSSHIEEWKKEGSGFVNQWNKGWRWWRDEG